MKPVVGGMTRPDCFLSLLLGCALVACGCTSESQRLVSRYVITVRPIDVLVGAQGLCVAVNPADRQGVWWWEPGTSGCSSRSTGPGVFHAEEARVSQSKQPGPINISFRVGTHSTTHAFVDVHLVLDSGDLRDVESGARVPTRQQNDLDVPGLP